MTPVREPREVPHRFAAAWNAGDAGGIAELFAPDADFVNVVGLWWRDRESIRRAHDHGLRVIFPGTVMRVSRVRVRELGPDVAVVHCRWDLHGQVLPGGGGAGARAGIFTFVACRDGGTWTVVAAHNTDIVAGAESLARRDGELAPVDYRRSGDR